MKKILAATLCAIAPPTFAAHASPAYPPFGFDLTARDPATKPGNDFFQYANGHRCRCRVLPFGAGAGSCLLTPTGGIKRQDPAPIGDAADQQRLQRQLLDIIFPAGILQPPIFDAAADPAINYGAAGAVIGHEITHQFDDQGRTTDADGVRRDWWTPADAAAFKARADVLGAQYAQFDRCRACTSTRA
jgi:predicted metalloendopeptidase